MNPTYIKLQEQSKHYGASTSNNCGVIALAAAANVDYAQAHKALEKLGRKAGQGTNLKSQLWPAFKSFGYDVVNQTDVYQYLCEKLGVKRLTPSRLARHLSKNRTFVAITRNHGLAIVNGEVADWTANRRNQVKWLFEIVAQ